MSFNDEFKALTNREPLSWQNRLYQHFENDSPPSVIDMPTGLGKTMVMAIWLIARAHKKSDTPTRLIYVVDRRTVVDQATDLADDLAFLLAPDQARNSPEIAPPKSGLAERKKNNAAVLSDLRRRLDLTGPADRLAISTLRGQLADNREWSKDPSKPAIIIGTVDLIGSALLFSGYRSSSKRRPLEAGLLGQDSLLVLDEAHLSRPFEKLICAIGHTGPHQKNRSDGRPFGKPMRVVCMSATSGKSGSDTFQLIAPDLDDSITAQRFTAKKRLAIKPDVDPKKLNTAIADAAIELAENPRLVGKRIVVFVRKPDDATRIAETIRKHAGTKAKPEPFANSVEVLTGTMRGLERDLLVEKPVFQNRWLNGDIKPEDQANQQPAFLISTSAGEVGFDLNADHLVGDAAPLDSWIQRLGRVNRRGHGDATVILIKQSNPPDKTAFDKACNTTSKLFADGMDVSPKALAAFKKRLTPKELKDATTPEPATVDLTDILLDAWSMTSIATPMPGRPEVAPWLRGIADDLPQTTIAWRAELDLPGFDQLDLDTIEEWFDTHRVLTHETLSVPTSSKSESSAEKWMKARWEQIGKTLGDEQQQKIGARPVVIDRAGLRVIPLTNLLAELDRGNSSSIRNADLILPASFGGIERRKGLLDPSAPEISKEENKKPIDEQPMTRPEWLTAPDVADVAPARPRSREIITKPKDAEPQKHVVANGARPSNPLKFRIELESDDDRRVQLVSYTPRREKPESGTSKPETLASHVRKVRKATDAILDRITLPEDATQAGIIKQAAQLAADFHDHGKNRQRWQRLLVFPPGFAPPNEPMGKSGGEMKPDGLRYRHEFGSLREFTDAFDAGKLLGEAGKPIDQDVFDLAIHLIATHHGRGRPHFPTGGFDPDCDSRSDAIHTESIRRFARLQRKYGWWHLAWLENLLRCADALASADSDAQDDPTDEKGGAL